MQSDPRYLYDHFDGGRAQIYLSAVEKYNVLYLGSIYDHSEYHHLNGQIDGSAEDSRYIENAHLKNIHYDDLLISLPLFFYKKNLINKEAYILWENIAIYLNNKIINKTKE